MGDYKDFIWRETYTHISLAEAREIAKNHCNGLMKENRNCSALVVNRRG